ncbi:MAG: prepilin-type N-terminal cleavage/methylation domain-containing protein, partial [Arenicella sp.]|nr:prepilin-type N-terminal cleavage/methylation domain-containing protein [Arenicella sp.]
MSLMLRQLGQRQLRPSQLRRQSTGFTLLEILMVLALLSLIASMLPSGLMGLHARADHQMLVQKVVVAARQCSITAQQQQRSIGLGSEACPLPTDTERLTVNAESLPLFHADGTASHTAHIVIDTAEGSIIKTAEGSVID